MTTIIQTRNRSSEGAATSRAAWARLARTVTARPGVSFLIGIGGLAAIGIVLLELS